ncbi:hypothetical protein ACB098_07G045900 [Castanea mollissima]
MHRCCDAMRIEEDTVNLLRKEKQQAKVRIPRAEAFTRMSNPHEGIEIFIPKTSSGGSLQTGDEAERQKVLDYLTLYRAALNGNWEVAESIRLAYPNAFRDSITEMYDTVLHIASATEHSTFVNQVVMNLTAEELEQENKHGYTSLYIAAESGIVTNAKEMVEKNRRLLLIRNKERTPLHVAALLGRRDMVSYLFSETPFEDLNLAERMDILTATITYDMYDIALRILDKDKSLETANQRTLALRELARKPFAIGSTSHLSLWKRCLNSRFKVHKNAFMQTLAHQLVERLSINAKQFQDLDEQSSSYVTSLLLDAAKVGNVEFLIILIRSYPDIIWKIDERKQSLFHIAVCNRQMSVFTLVNEMVAIKQIILTFFDPKRKQNILHIAGYLPPSCRLNIVSGAALQMQQELLWFKEVAKVVPSSYLNKKNSKGLTPGELFTREHKNLRKEGENWMKNTANYCMIVATLITTVVFAAAFTVPGGNNQETGTPIFFKTSWFRVFFISNAIALVSSSSSILIFLSILTSRFTEKDFLTSLPSQLVLGFTTLFISIVSMVVAFSTTSFLVFKSEMVWLPIVIIILASVPIILFVWLHYKLWVDIFMSTFLSGFSFRSSKKRIF